MSAVPDIQVFNLGGQDRFMLCGCDGFWSCFSPEDAVQAVSGMLEKGKPLKAICNRLVNMVGHKQQLLRSALCNSFGFAQVYMRVVHDSEANC